LRRRQLQHGGGAAIGGKVARRYAGSHRDRPAVAVEEDEVERESHAEGVDAGAAWDQQAGSGLLQIQMSEAQQTSPATGSDRDLAA